MGVELVRVLGVTDACASVWRRNGDLWAEWSGYECVSVVFGCVEDVFGCELSVCCVLCVGERHSE